VSKIPTPAILPRGLNIKQAAAYWGVSPNTFRKLIKAGLAPAPLKLPGLDRNVYDRVALDAAMRCQIPRPAGRPVKSGTVFERTAEEEAFERWRGGQFLEVERLAAAFWRKTLEELDLGAIQKELRSLGFTQKTCKTLQDAKAVADAVVGGTDNPYAKLALAIQFFQIPRELHPAIAQAWKSAGKRTFTDFAPYAAYALGVEIFFQVALGAGLIGGEKPSNRTDIA
jgi:hypothetical protein